MWAIDNTFHYSDYKLTTHIIETLKTHIAPEKWVDTLDGIEQEVLLKKVKVSKWQAIMRQLLIVIGRLFLAVLSFVLTYALVYIMTNSGVGIADFVKEALAGSVPRSQNISIISTAIAVVTFVRGFIHNAGNKA